MRKLISLLLCFLFPSAYAMADAATIMVASDLHYCAPSLYEGSDLFVRSIQQGDGKVVHQSTELLRALLDQARRIRPDALVLTGDLTFNGEKQSHLELAAALETLVDEGIAVYVLPGNHDINNLSARRFIGESYEAAESVTADAFRSIYHRLMAPISESSAGLSYTVSLSNDLQLCMLDCAYYEPSAMVFGFLDENRYQFLENALSQAEREGRRVVTATHHSVVPHSSLYQESFVILNSQRIRQALRDHGVTLHLSGHLHVQHIAEEDGLFDICSGALSVYPHRYGLVRLSGDGSVTYDALPLSDDLLPDGFMDMSREWFRTTTSVKTSASLEALNLSQHEIDDMLNYACDLNQAYFSGELKRDDTAFRADPAYALWQRSSEKLFFGRYLDLILSEASPDALHLPWPE